MTARWPQVCPQAGCAQPVPLSPTSFSLQRCVVNDHVLVGTDGLNTFMYMYEHGRGPTYACPLEQRSTIYSHRNRLRLQFVLYKSTNELTPICITHLARLEEQLADRQHMYICMRMRNG